MPYYTGMRGDYYRGDYYRGDPGLFSFVGKALGGAAKAATFLLPGPAGAIARGALSAATPSGPVPPNVSLVKQTGLFNINQPGLPQFDHSPVGPGMKIMTTGGAACPVKHHANKSTYVTRGGGTSRWPMSLQVHPKGTECVTNRRMNVGNARALRRAIRRVAGFAKLVKRSKRAIARAASAVGVHRGGRARHPSRAPSVRIVKSA